MIESLWWAFVLRSAQALIEASPTLLSGVLIAGILRRMVGPEGTRRLFGGPGWRGLLQSWAVGMVLPVCSLGVLPVAREMRRAGVAGGNVLAFLLVAPLLNPISFLYGLTLAEPIVIIGYVAGSLLLALAAGLTWKRLFPTTNIDSTGVQEPEPLPVPGPRRLLAVAVTAARELAGPLAVYVLIAAITTGLLSAALPRGMMQRTMQPTDPSSPLLMAVLVGPAYMGPLPGMVRIGLMFEHGNSAGAAFVLFVLGIGVNVGLVAWAVRAYGWKPAGAWFGMIAVATVALGYAMEKPFYPKIEPADHTHAFDDFTSPFYLGQSVPFDTFKGKLLAKVEVLEPVALLGLALLALFALVERTTGIGPRLETFLTRQPWRCAGLASGPAAMQAQRRRAKWDVEIPGPVLGVLALVGLVVFSVVSAFIYYPPKKQVFTEMVAVRADTWVAVHTNHPDEAIRRLEQWDLLTRKLQVGAFLRSMRYDKEAAEKADDLREAMEKVRDALLAGETEEAKKGIDEVDLAWKACKSAYNSERLAE